MDRLSGEDYASLTAAVLLGAGLLTGPMAQAQDCEERITSGGWIEIDIGSNRQHTSRGNQQNIALPTAWQPVEKAAR